MDVPLYFNGMGEAANARVGEDGRRKPQRGAICLSALQQWQICKICSTVALCLAAKRRRPNVRGAVDGWRVVAQRGPVHLHQGEGCRQGCMEQLGKSGAAGRPEQVPVRVCLQPALPCHLLEWARPRFLKARSRFHPGASSSKVDMKKGSKGMKQPGPIGLLAHAAGGCCDTPSAGGGRREGRVRVSRAEEHNWQQATPTSVLHMLHTLHMFSTTSSSAQLIQLIPRGMVQTWAG